MTDDQQQSMDDNGAPPVTDAIASVTHPAPDPVKEEIAVAPAAPSTQAASRDSLVLGLMIATGVLFVLTVLLALAVFAPGIAPIKSSTIRLGLEAREEKDVVKIAERFAANFLTVNYKTIDADFDKVTADATGSFKEQLGKVLLISKEQFQKAKATSTGKVTQSFVLSFDEDNAVVRCVADRTINNAKTKGPKSGVQVLDVTLVKTADGWKVEDLRQLGTEGNP